VTVRAVNRTSSESVSETVRKTQISPPCPVHVGFREIITRKHHKTYAFIIIIFSHVICKWESDAFRLYYFRERCVNKYAIFTFCSYAATRLKNHGGASRYGPGGPPGLWSTRVRADYQYDIMRTPFVYATYTGTRQCNCSDLYNDVIPNARRRRTKKTRIYYTHEISDEIWAKVEDVARRVILNRARGSGTPRTNYSADWERPCFLHVKKTRGRRP